MIILEITQLTFNKVQDANAATGYSEIEFTDPSSGQIIKTIEFNSVKLAQSLVDIDEIPILGIGKLSDFNSINIDTIQYKNKEKGIIIARVEQKWLAPAGELMVFDLKELATDNKVEVLIFSKDLLDSGVNFNRNVKNVNRLMKELKNTLS